MTEADAIQIRDACRRNGGPLATRAADCITALLRQVPQKPRGRIDPNHAAIVLLFQRRLNKPHRDAKEIRAYHAIKHLITEEDLKNLSRWMRQPNPKGFHKLLSPRKKTPVTLMRDYVSQTDLAAEWCRQNPPPADPKKPKFPEPKGWEAHAPGNLGKFSWSMVCQQYPDIAKDLSEQLHHGCTPSAPEIKK